MDNRQIEVNRISLIIPAYNEGERLGQTLNSYVRYLSEVTSDKAEIIVICNGCTDKTPQIAEEFSLRFPQVKAINIPERIGKGAAISVGFRMAHGAIIAFVDADGSIKPEEMGKLIEAIDQGYDAAIASRWLSGAQIEIEKPLNWRLASRVFNLLVRLLFRLPFNDTQCGAKAFKDYVIHNLTQHLKVSGMSFDVELLWRAKQRGYKIKEVPITWEHKQKVGLTNNLSRTIPRMAIEIMKLRLRP